MIKYLSLRIFQIFPVLLIITLIVFSLVYVAGDPVVLMLPEEASQEDIDNMREALGLDKPFIIQYFSFLGDVFTGDFGESYRFNQPALPIVLERLPNTFMLAGASMVIAVLISIPLGILSSLRKGRLLDVIITGGATLGRAMPNFWLGIMLILLFSVNLQIFPVSGAGSMWHLVLPAITLGTAVAAEMARLVRSNMLETLGQDYIRTAKGKGLHHSKVIYKHAFKNTLVPVITIMFLQTSSLIGGALITEQVFAYPGLGQLLIQAVNTSDMAIVQASVFIIALLVILMNLIADILYRFLDPRIKID